MSALVIHPATQTVLDGVLSNQPHALLFTGPHGVGLKSIADKYARKRGGVIETILPEKDEIVDLEKGVITVDQVRHLYTHTRTLEPKGRVLIIDYAERMGMAAQNAFLKLLEEPTEGTCFLLLTHEPDRLLPTISSRAQHVQVRPVTKAQSEALLDLLEVREARMRTQLLFIASGLPAELQRLVSDTTYFGDRVQIVKDAREFISGTPYQRLKIAYTYKDRRQDALTLLSDATKQLQQTTAEKGESTSVRMLGRLEALHLRITEQSNVRLQLSSAALL